jgi:hypothetical protein
MLVTVDDLADHMDIRFSNRQERAAEVVLAGLQSEIEAFLRRPIEVNEYTEDYIVPSAVPELPNTSFFYNYDNATTADSNLIVSMSPADVVYYTIYIRNSPIHEVTSLGVTTPIDASPTAQTEGVDFIVHRSFIDLYRVRPNDKVTITYTAGLDGTKIPILRSLILRAATRETQNLHDDTIGVKALTSREVAPLETGFTDRELASVRRWKRQIGGSTSWVEP